MLTGNIEIGKLCEEERKEMGGYWLMDTEIQFVSFWWMFSGKNILEMDGNDDCKTLWMYLRCANSTLKSGLIVNFLLCILYQNKTCDQ